MLTGEMQSISFSFSYEGYTPAYQIVTADSDPNTWTEHWMATFPAGSDYDPSQAWSDYTYVMNNYGDSAACATHMISGIKTANGRVNVSADASTAFFTIGETAKGYGMSVGAVSSVPASHATPGAWVAHNDDRVNAFAIADEGFFGDPNTTGTVATDYKYGGGHGPTMPPADVLIGAGNYNNAFVSTQLLSKLSSESGQPGKHVLVQQQAGVNAGDPGNPLSLIAVANNPNITKLAGLFDNHPYYYADNSGYNPEHPTLSESAEAALKVLSRNPNGFVLMIEGGAIDWAAHGNYVGDIIGEQRDFDNAVQTVTSWVEKTGIWAGDTGNQSWLNSLVIAAGDHDCGYLAANKLNNVQDIATQVTAPIGPVTDYKIGKEKMVSGTGGRRASWEDTNGNNIIDGVCSDPQYTTQTDCEANSETWTNTETVYWYWNSPNHTNSLIPLYVKGTGSEIFATCIATPQDPACAGWDIDNDPVRGAYIDDTNVFLAMDDAIMNQTCVVTGSLSIISGQSLYGSTIDLTSLLLSYNTSDVTFDVFEPGAVCQGEDNVSLITKLDTWKYNGDNLGDIQPDGEGDLWKDTDYDDSQWNTGNGFFGYGNGSEPFTVNTTIGAPGQYTAYFRNTFEICNPSEVTALTFNGAFDDGLAVYINGQQVITHGVSGNPPVWNGGAVSHSAWDQSEANYEVYDLTAHTDKLVSGTNVIAVGLYNADGTSSDLLFDGELVISSNAINTVLHSDIYNNSQNVDTSTWTDGTKTIQVSGNDSTCLVPVTPAIDTFYFADIPADADSLLISNSTPVASVNPQDGELGIVLFHCLMRDHQRILKIQRSIYQRQVPILFLLVLL
jgi:alkaline phosphatase